MKKTLYILPMVLIAMACSHKTTAGVDSGVVAGYSGASVQVDADEQKPVKTVMQQVKSEGVLPFATAFRMSGDYADNVAVTLGPDGSLLYFPDPKDINADSEPIDLGNGWWLNNQGIGLNSVFTKFTFAEYAALAETPSPQQLLKDIIPGAKVTQMVELPYKVGDTSNNIEAIKEYLKQY